MAELKRTLNLVEVTFFVAGVILGAGIYTIIGEAAGFGGNMLWLSFLIAFVTALLTAFSYAELVSTGSLSLIGEIKTVGLITNFFVFNTCILVNATVIYLIIKNNKLKRPFRIPGNIKNIPVVSVIAILLTLVMVGFSVYGLRLH